MAWNRTRAALVAVVWALACGGSPSEAQPAAFEPPHDLAARDELPAAMLKGPDFSVHPVVKNDGFMNRYLLRTTWGNLEVVSSPLLRKREHETRGIRHIHELSKSKEFAEGIGQAGKGAVHGAVNLVTKPIDTASSAVSGVGKLFGMAKDAATGDREKSDTEDASWKQAAGFAQTKRNYAKAMGVDVYSRSPMLQKALDDLSWAGWAGGVTGGLAMMAIPGGAGIAVSVSKNTDLMNRIDVSRPPSEVRKANRGKLLAAGVDAAAVDRFSDDSTLSPTEQSLIVAALEDMKGVADRSDFLEFAAAAPDADVATFVVLQARMYQQYHASHEPIARFQRIGMRLVARTGDGSVVAIHPTDHLFWTEAVAGITATVDPKVSGAPRKLLWVGGKVSDSARQGLAANGWEVRESALQELIKD